MHENMDKKSLTVVIPSYNDVEGLKEFLPGLITESEKQGWHVIVVNDGSTDSTENFLRSYNGKIKLVSHNANQGYGVALKSGIAAAETYWVATIDADGQHRIEDLRRMSGEIDDTIDALIGVRTAQSHTPTIRRPGKRVLHLIANLLTSSKIPDINCGLRIFQRDIIMQIFSITSDHFSFSTSALIALLQLKCRVRYTPVLVTKRLGKSSVKQIRDGFHTIMLMIRLIFLFNPFRILFPIGLAISMLGMIFLCIHLFVARMTTTTILVWLTGLLVFLFSLIADQISGMRKDFIIREIKCIRKKRKY